MREVFGVSEHGAIGLRWMRTDKPNSKATGLYYYPDIGEYEYVTGANYRDDWFHLSKNANRPGYRFQNMVPNWLSPHHRRIVHAMLMRFVECVRESPDAAGWMGMHAYLKLLAMLGLES